MFLRTSLRIAFWEGLNSEQMSKRWLDCFRAKFHANKQPHGSGFFSSRVWATQLQVLSLKEENEKTRIAETFAEKGWACGFQHLFD